VDRRQGDRRATPGRRHTDVAVYASRLAVDAIVDDLCLQTPGAPLDLGALCQALERARHCQLAATAANVDGTT
jgi:hypothetical protein